MRLARVPVPEPTTRSGPPTVKAVELWDLVSAFGRLVRETMTHQPQTITVDHTPLHVHMETILERLTREGPLAFSALFVPPHTRSRLVGLFQATLELVKERRIAAEQEESFTDIRIVLTTTSPER